MAVATFGDSAISSLQNALARGASRADAGVGAAQAGVDAVRAGGAQVRSDTNAMRDQARFVNAQADSVGMTAKELEALATTLAPYADKLGGYGDDLNTIAQSLVSQSGDAFGQARALVNMDSGATGLAAEFLKQYGVLSPENYVSRAASDTQSSVENSMAQNERALARRGVGAGSGAGLALRQQYQRALAELSASAKTKAWDTGNRMRSEFLGTMTNASKTFYDMGLQGAAAATSALGAAADAQKGAAGVVGAQGGLLKDAGSLQAQAGSLFANAASIFGSAAGIETDFLNLTQKAYAGLASAYGAAADYYARAGSAEVSANSGGGGGGVNVTSPKGDFWENTGHSSTWWKNNNPGMYEVLAVQANEQ